MIWNPTAFSFGALGTKLNNTQNKIPRAIPGSGDFSPPGGKVYTAKSADSFARPLGYPIL